MDEAKKAAKKKTALEALAKWDAGEILWTVEMGGLGPGYEQSIQMLVFEIIRDNEQPLPVDTFGTWGDAAAHRADRQAGGFSGAQVGAAKGLAYRALRDGWDAMVESAPEDRRIQVSRNWPRPPDALAREEG